MGLIVSYDDVEERGTDSGGGIIFYYKGEPLTGMIQEVVNGILIGESEFTDGHEGGVQRFYFPNGQVQEEFFIHFNKLEGTYTFWDENGNITRLSHWKNGKQII
jgi:antitoxin component YwqK of YwqJK toxin-antitoxin module